MENVDRAQQSQAYSQARGIFQKAGYGLTEVLLNAVNFGVPQNRRRFFCIGLLGATDGFLTEDLLLRKREYPTTVGEHFKAVGHKTDIRHYYRHPRNYSRRAVFSFDEPAPTIRGVNRPVPPNYPGHAGDTHKVSGVRQLTSKERSLLQTFPVDFILPDSSKTTVELMIGNAVPVKLAEAVARIIRAYEVVHGGPPPTRGKKPTSPTIGDINREAFMRWVLAENHAPDKTVAKNTWAELTRAGKFIQVDDESSDTDMLVFKCRKAAKAAGISAATVSRMQGAVRHYREYRQLLVAVKNPTLAFHQSHQLAVKAA